MGVGEASCAFRRLTTRSMVAAVSCARSHLVPSHVNGEMLTTPYVKVLVRWATGKRLTNRLPNLSLITFSPLERTGYTGRRATNTRFQLLGIQKFFFQILDMRKFTF